MPSSSTCSARSLGLHRRRRRIVRSHRDSSWSPSSQMTSRHRSSSAFVHVHRDRRTRPSRAALGTPLVRTSWHRSSARHGRAGGGAATRPHRRHAAHLHRRALERAVLRFVRLCRERTGHGAAPRARGHRRESGTLRARTSCADDRHALIGRRSEHRHALCSAVIDGNRTPADRNPLGTTPPPP